jgi:hypothetical protein
MAVRPEAFFPDERINCAGKRAVKKSKEIVENDATVLPFLTGIYCHFAGLLCKLFEELRSGAEEQGRMPAIGRGICHA